MVLGGGVKKRSKKGQEYTKKVLKRRRFDYRGLENDSENPVLM